MAVGDSSETPLGRAEAIDDFESHLGEATEKCERNRGKYERLARTLGHVGTGERSRKAQSSRGAEKSSFEKHDTLISNVGSAAFL